MMWYGQIQGNLGIAKSNEEIETARPCLECFCLLSWNILESQFQPEIAMVGFPPQKMYLLISIAYVL